MTAAVWMLAIISLAGTVLVTEKRAEGFYLWAATNCGWVAIDAYAGLYGQAVMFLAYFGISIYGIWKWKK